MVDSRNKAAQSKRRVYELVIQLFLLVLAILVLLPFVYILLISLGDNVADVSSTVPKSFSLNNYAKLFSETKFLNWLGNSVVVALGTMLVAIVLVSAAVYVFSRMRFRGKQKLFSSILLLQVFPLTLSMVSLFKIFVTIGLLNNLLSLVLVNSVLASAGLILVAKGYFDTIPYELDEAAAIDGASRMTILVKIVLPLALPMISFVAIQSFVLSYNEYVIASAIMSEGVDTLPLAVGLQSMLQGQFGQNWSLYCAGAVLGSLPMIILFYSLQKYFIGDLVAGGVKG